MWDIAIRLIGSHSNVSTYVSTMGNKEKQGETEHAAKAMTAQTSRKCGRIS